MKEPVKAILYADDDPDDLALFREAVTALGEQYYIIEAMDGIHALELLRQMQESNELPCLIVLDINMPRLDGKQTLVALQNHPLFSSIPVVLFSTSSSVLDKTFSQSKKVELITKPFDFKTLYDIAGKLLSYCNV
jgi:CheY-like chemotaxis protein